MFGVSLRFPHLLAIARTTTWWTASKTGQKEEVHHRPGHDHRLGSWRMRMRSTASVHWAASVAFFFYLSAVNRLEKDRKKPRGQVRH